MKSILTTFLVVSTLLWSAVTELQALISMDLVISPIDHSNANEPVHEFSIVYTSPDGIDVASLGDDDVEIGRGSLFEPQLADKAFYADLVATEEAAGGQKVTATYRLYRPEDGWESYGLQRLSIYVESGSISEKSGNYFRGDGPGNLKIDLETIPVMTIRMLQYPIVGSDDPSIQFQAVYRANVPLDLDLFGQGEMIVYKRFGTNGVIDVDIPFEGFEAALESIEANPDQTVVTADYRLDRPETGWGDIDLWVRLITEKLGTNDHTNFPGSGNRTLGYGRIVRDGAVTAALLEREPVLITAESFVLDVIYESGTSKVDVTTLGDDDFGKWVNLFDSLQVSVELQEVLSTENDGRRVTARYVVSPPEGETWSVLARGTLPGLNEHLDLYSNVGSVLAEDGSPLGGGRMGSVYFDVPAGVVLPQLVALDDWFQELRVAIGSGNVTFESDHDRDGLEDVIEFMLGTDPLDGTDATAIDVQIQEEREDRRVLLTFKNRLNVSDAELVLEGSANGESWFPMTDYFEVVNQASPTGLELTDVKARSVSDIATFPYRLFRVRVVTEE